jgi:chorismate-pyruvate lyase
MKESLLAPPSSHPALSGLHPLDELYARRGGAVSIVQTNSASLDLITEFYARRGQAALFWAPIEAAAVPEPYRSLLVHWTDMTSTLENFYKEKLRVQVLARHLSGQDYFREVALWLDPSGRRVAYGATRVRLGLVPADVGREILREEEPLGRILTESGVEFSSQPRAYVQIVPDDFINRSLDLAGPQVLYGRRNTLVDPWERTLADIVEILPPA